MNSIIDRTFGIGNQARAVMEMLDRAPDFADYENGRYKIHLETKPWYNGREQGIVISMARSLASLKVIHISFFEHRNSDRICALTWETTNFYWNHPLEDPDIFEKAYKGKYDVDFSVGYGESGEMAQWVYDTLADFYGKTKEKSNAE